MYDFRAKQTQRSRSGNCNKKANRDELNETNESKWGKMEMSKNVKGKGWEGWGWWDGGAFVMHFMLQDCTIALDSAGTNTGGGN